MANLFAYGRFDQNALNFHRLNSGDSEKELLKDANVREGGLFFEDMYVVSWSYNGDNYGSAFLGRDFSVDSNSDPDGGIFEGYVELQSNGTRFVPLWTLTGTSLSLTEVYAVTQTPGRADDLKFVNEALAGDDIMYLNRGNDRANGLDGNDLLRGGAGRDSLTGGNGDDKLFGQGGSDHLYLDKGNDLLNGGIGRDWVHARGGRDVQLDLLKSGEQSTGFGTDLLVSIENASGAGGDDVLKGTGGRNILAGKNGDDRLFGRNGNDLLQGQNGSDFLHGGGGRDNLQGGAGEDVLIGFRGRDVLVGGADADRFVFRALNDTSARLGQSDIIRDFTPGEDVIDLRGIDASRQFAGNNAFTFTDSGRIGRSAEGEVTYRHLDRPGVANDLTVVMIDTDGDRGVEAQIRLRGILDLGADDFLL
ncbi:calcium-binding protein [Paracoccus fistulariae]|uniref:M10 family metallopeptidase C-terminal domain-containing protein n=1 Tax=Paracoccus fistulariae TaxID=658446 RepID=A0ABY7SHB4_9RHOB|nr:M10 family metallopeptidase C-terminal domain-containing protein [Paracoccus fistulariae]MDB6181038.1 M10 family metallopeptidase C-terminal domain-containing protein [Paracoccus fistulariae]WCR06333.1 M10 family metallopeptidase C-terminal domain-containing protein [Paracoccus fistulariae]